MSVTLEDGGTVLTIKARTTISPMRADQARDLAGMIEYEKRRLLQDVLDEASKHAVLAHSDSPVRDAMQGRSMPVVVTAQIKILK